MSTAKLKELAQSDRSQKCFPMRAIIERRRCGHITTEPKLKQIVVFAIFFLRLQRLEHRFTERSVARTTTQVSLELIVDMTRIEISPVISLEHRADESWRAW